MSDLYFNDGNDYSEENTVLSLNRKKLMVMRAMKKKLNIFTLLLPIYYILEQ